MTDIKPTQKVPSLTCGAFFCWLFGIYRRRRVQGRSMEPLLLEGDEVLIEPRARFKGCQVNDLVWLQHPSCQGVCMVKRIDKIDRSSECIFVVGENPNYSTDSRQLGWVPLSHMLGTVRCCFSRAGKGQ